MRIMTSAFVVAIAYWHGEMAHGEASRYMAMARLLLEYPRWRWGENLEAIRTIDDISRLGDLRIGKKMRTLLPRIGDIFPSLSGGESLTDIEADDLTAADFLPEHLELEARRTALTSSNEPIALGPMSGPFDGATMQGHENMDFQGLLGSMEYFVGNAFCTEYDWKTFERDAMMVF